MVGPAESMLVAIVTELSVGLQLQDESVFDELAAPLLAVGKSSAAALAHFEHAHTHAAHLHQQQ